MPAWIVEEKWFMLGTVVAVIVPQIVAGHFAVELGGHFILETSHILGAAEDMKNAGFAEGRRRGGPRLRLGVTNLAFTARIVGKTGKVSCMQTQEVKRFDHVWAETLEVQERMKSKCSSAGVFLRQAREAAYRFTKNVMLLTQHYHNEFMDHVASLKDPVSGRHMTIDQWLDDQYMPLLAIGETQRDIQKAIEEGMTEKQYVHLGMRWNAAKKDRDMEQKVRSSVSAPPPSSTLSVPEQLHRALQQIAELKQLVTELSRENRKLKDDHRRMTTSLESLERRIQRVLSAKTSTGEIVSVQA